MPMSSFGSSGRIEATSRPIHLHRPTTRRARKGVVAREPRPHRSRPGINRQDLRSRTPGVIAESAKPSDLDNLGGGEWRPSEEPTERKKSRMFSDREVATDGI